MSLHIRPNDVVNIAEALKHPQTSKRPHKETKVHIKNEEMNMTIKTFKNINRT